MKKSFLVIAAVLCLSTFGFSQYQFAALEKAKEIKLLHTDQAAVKSLMGNYELALSDDDLDRFSSEEATIEVNYSADKCDEDGEVIWDVPAGRVVLIEVFPEKKLKLEDLGIDLSALVKEQFYANEPDHIIFHDKQAGFAIEVDGDGVDKFILFPPLRGKPKACSKTEKAKEFVSSKSWFGKSKLKDRSRVVYCPPPASVTDVTLSTEELKDLALSKEISVSVTAIDPENDVLVYNYVVSAGKIVEKGPDVVWDLKNVKPGVYTITAGVDDGCGICGATKTKTVVIK
jgi:hypothetical protein